MTIRKRPKLFENPRDSQKRMENDIDTSMVKYAAQAITELNKSLPMDQRLEIQQMMPKYLVIAECRGIKHGVIDLKPYFARSPNRNLMDNGGWYLTVPIRRKVSSMSHALYQEARAVNIPKGRDSIKFSAQHLYDNRPVADIQSLNYKPVSNNLTKIRDGKNRSMYVAFRTVSSSSPPSSWIVGRQNANRQDMSKTLLANLDRMMKWKMKNM